MNTISFGLVALLVGFALGWAPSAYRAWRFRQTVRQCAKAFTKIMSATLGPKAPEKYEAPTATPIGNMNDLTANLGPPPVLPANLEELPSCGCGNAVSHWIGKCPFPGPPIGQAVRDYHAARQAQTTEPGRSLPEPDYSRPPESDEYSWPPKG